MIFWISLKCHFFLFFLVSQVSPYQLFYTMPDTSHIDIISIQAPTTGNPKSFSFSTNSAADCFSLYVLPSMRDETFKVQIKDSANHTFPEFKDKDLYDESVSNDNFISDKGNIEFSLPIVSQSYPTIGGTWTGQMKYNAQDGVPTMKVAQRITFPENIDQYTLQVNLVLYSSNTNLDKKKQWINKEIKTVKRIFEQASINCSFSTILVAGTPPVGISDNFWSTTTGQVVQANAKTDQLTVIIVENLIVKLPLEAGIAGGIPGPQGFINNFAAVLVKITNDPSDPLVVNKDFMAFTMAHEMGHYLGLTHESAGSDNTNLMYYKLNGLTDGSLNAKQIFILQNMPLVQIVYRGSAVKTPITQLQVIVTTGTRWPGYLDGPGTDMNVNFSLGSDANGYQTWELNSWGNDFVSGTVDTFTFTNIQNLFVEDINTWKIICSWSADMYIPFIGGQDCWNFKHIKILANGVVVDDREVDIFLSYQLNNNNYIKKYK